MERHKEGTTMSFSPTEFMSYVDRNNGIALSHNFKVKFGEPQKQLDTTVYQTSFIRRNVNRLNFKDIDLLCHSAKILGKAINANAQIYGYGSEYNLPVNEGFEDLTLSFHCTWGKGDWNNGGIPERRIFDDWMAQVIDPTDNHTGFKNEYARDIDIELINPTNGVVSYKQKFYSAIPLTITDLDLTSAGNELLTFDVTFTYDNWVINNDI